MDIDSQKFMAREGLVEWLAASVLQGQRLEQIYEEEFRIIDKLKPAERSLLAARSRTEANFMANAANQALKYLDWVHELQILGDVDFSPLDDFNRRDIIDLRNMREHVIEYFLEKGNRQDRWFTETPEYKADASSMVVPMIGGRLNFRTFSKACDDVLHQVFAASHERSVLP